MAPKLAAYFSCFFIINIITSMSYFHLHVCKLLQYVNNVIKIKTKILVRNLDKWFYGSKTKTNAPTVREPCQPYFLISSGDCSDSFINHNSYTWYQWRT